MTYSRDDDVLREPVATTVIRSKPWFKSCASSGTCACVEVRFLADQIMVRDSKFLRFGGDPNLQPIISVSIGAWLIFLEEVIGEAVPGANSELDIDKRLDGSVSFHSVAEDVQLTYTPEEWIAFVSGVKAGEFTPVLQAV